MNLRSWQIDIFHVSKLIGTDLHLFELSVWIQSLAQAMISVFVPIILYNLGLPIKSIILFYIIFNAFDVPLNLVARSFIQRFGARTAVIFGIISQIGYFVMLYNLRSGSWFEITLLALLLAIYDSFYWVSHLFIFLGSASQKMRLEVGELNALRLIGGLVAPAIGAYVLIFGGQQTLIFFATILILVSLIPLFKMRHLQFKPELPTKKFKEFFRRPFEKANYTLESFAAVRQEMEDMIWPFFIFFLFGSIRNVAFVPILIALAGILLNYFTARISSRKNVYQLIAYGALAVSLFWVLRISTIGNIPITYITVFCIATLGILIDLPLEVAVFDRGRKTDPLNTTMYLNLFRMAARGIFYVVLFFSSDIFTAAFYIIAAVLFVMFIISLYLSFKQKELMKLEPEPIEMKAE